MLQSDLGLTDAEMGRMPYRRFVQWMAFYKVRAEKEEAAHKAAMKKNSRGKGPNGIVSS